MKISVVVSTVLLLATATANASVLRLDFLAMLVDTGAADIPVSGFLLIDSATAPRDVPIGTIYDSAVIGGAVDIGELSYDYFPSTTFNGVYMVNDFNGRDTLQIATGLFDPDTNDFRLFLLQFEDAAGAVFDDESFPTSLDLADFDSTFSGGFGTFVLSEFQGPITFIDLRAIPLPAPAWLLLSALLLIRKRGRGNLRSG